MYSSCLLFHASQGSWPRSNWRQTNDRTDEPLMETNWAARRSSPSSSPLDCDDTIEIRSIGINEYDLSSVRVTVQAWLSWKDRWLPGPFRPILNDLSSLFSAGMAKRYDYRSPCTINCNSSQLHPCHSAFTVASKASRSEDNIRKNSQGKEFACPPMARKAWKNDAGQGWIYEARSKERKEILDGNFSSIVINRHLIHVPYDPKQQNHQLLNEDYGTCRVDRHSCLKTKMD